MSKKKNKKKVCLYLDETVMDQARRVSEKTGVSMSFMAEQSLADCVGLKKSPVEMECVSELRVSGGVIHEASCQIEAKLKN